MKIIEAIGTGKLKILWDAREAMYCIDRLQPEGYERGKCPMRHVHIKGEKLDIAGARAAFRSLGQGDMSPYLYDIVDALMRDGLDGIVSV